MPIWKLELGDCHAHRKLVLTDHRARFVEDLVTSGRYQNANKVLREGLRLVERRESEDELRLAVLCDAVKTGLADIEAGNFRHFDSADMLARPLTALASEVMGT